MGEDLCLVPSEGNDPSAAERFGRLGRPLVAKDVVAAGDADPCKVHVAYGIGGAQPAARLAPASARRCGAYRCRNPMLGLVSPPFGATMNPSSDPAVPVLGAVPSRLR